MIYVKPNDVVDDHDVYGEFLEQVGSAVRRQSLRTAQRSLLERRDEIEPLPPTPPASASAIAPSASSASTPTPVQRLARSTPLDQLQLFAHPPRL